MDRPTLRHSLEHVGSALRAPEEFLARWQRGEARYPVAVWLGLAATAVIGTSVYGLTMGPSGGVGRALESSVLFTLAAGLAWAIPLPGIYILNSLTGSRLAAATTLLASLVTVSWGGLAMIASVPVTWFFAAALPGPRIALIVHLAVFACVGIAMWDVFGRVLRAVEPTRPRAPFWLLVPVAALGTELFAAFGLFRFDPPA